MTSERVFLADNRIGVYPSGVRRRYRCIVCGATHDEETPTLGIETRVDGVCSRAFCCLERIAALQEAITAVPAKHDAARIRSSEATRSLYGMAFHCPVCRNRVTGEEPFVVIGTLHCHQQCTDGLASMVATVFDESDRLLGRIL